MPHFNGVDAGFVSRTRQFLNSAATAAKTWYNSDGSWEIENRPPLTRERFWIAPALYAAEEVSLADSIIQRGETRQSGPVRFDIFDTNIAASLLCSWGSLMAPETQRRLEQLVCDGFSMVGGNRQPDYQFQGFNDNMPAKATMGLILGGERLECGEAVEYGLWNLRQFCAQLTRRGINSEFNSPTYTPLTLRALAEIATYTRTEEARALSIALEERLWIDLAARFHPGIGLLSGPSSRSYTTDTLGQLSCAAALLWFVIGDGAHPSPMELFNPDSPLVFHQEGDIPFNIAQFVYFAAAEYHPPGEAMELFTRRSYPFRAVASAEIGSLNLELPSSNCRVETYLEEDYSVGTASTPFLDGPSCMTYFATYRRADPVLSYRNVGTVFHKFLVNDARFGYVPETACSPKGEQQLVRSSCNSFAVQKNGSVLVLTHPHLFLAGTPIQRMEEAVVFPAFFGTVDEVIVGGREYSHWAGEVTHGQWIGCRVGRLLIAIRPLGASQRFGLPEIRLKQQGKYQWISTNFYQGDNLTLDREDLATIMGGFVAEHASVDQFSSLKAFCESLQEASFTDYYWFTRRTRYRRKGLEIDISWSPGSRNPQYVAIDGDVIETPKLQIDSISMQKIPLINGGSSPVPDFFPWKDFRIQWKALPYVIGDRGGNAL